MKQVSFEDRIAPLLATMPLAERRMARFFADNKQATVLGSATQIAARAGTSDATVVRTAQSLGFRGLAELREVMLADLLGAPAPSERLERTLDEAGGSGARVLRHALEAHEGVLATLKTEGFGRRFEGSLALLGLAEVRHVFGIGPSGSVATYAALQFNRIGLRSAAMDVSGIALADRLMAIGPNDAVLMFAYAPIYREVEATLEQAREVGVPVVLVTDDLGSFIADMVHEVLRVPRGKAGHLAMHGSTTVLVDAMVAGLAALHRDASMESLASLSRLRGRLDGAWTRRGVRRPKIVRSRGSSEGTTP